MIRLTHRSTYPTRTSGDELVPCRIPYKLVRVITDPHREGIRHWIVGQDGKGVTLHWEISDATKAEGWDGTFEIVVQDAEKDPAPVVLLSPEESDEP